jgi:putative FmdB family regulatory protein
MPLYDYECAACGRRFEVFHGVHAEGPTSCPLCGKGPVRKAITAAAVHYRGSGWAKKERRTAAASKTGGDGVSGDGGRDEGSKSETSKSETSKGDTSGEGAAAATSGGSGAKGKSSKTADKTTAATGD